MMNNVTKTDAFLLGMGMVFDVFGNLGWRGLSHPGKDPLWAREFAEVGAEMHKAMDALDAECHTELPRPASAKKQ